MKKTKNDKTGAFRMLIAGFWVSAIVLVACSRGMVEFLNETEPRYAKINWVKNVPQYISGASAGNYIDLEWSATNAGQYTARLNGGCDTGAFPAGGEGSGAISDRQKKIIRVQASELQLGDNSITICLRVTGQNELKMLTAVIHRDDTPPVTTASVGSGDYATAQSVVLSCSDHCLKTVFTLDGTLPVVASDGSIINGMPYTSALNLADPSTQTLRYLSVDKAGNIEAAASGGLYRIDSTNITLAFASVATYNLSTNGYTSSAIQWTTNRPGVAFDIRLNSTDCTTGTILTSGTAAASNNYTLSAAALAAGGNNLRICSTNYLGVAGSVSAAFNQQNTVPTTSHTLAAGNYSAVPTVTLSCTTGCSIVYTTDGTTPAVNASGTITNGTLYPVGGFTVPDQTVTTVKYLGFDAYGNREASSHSAAYNVDSVPASLAFASVSTYKLSSGGYTSSAIQWTTNRPGTAFSIRLSSTDCSTGTVLTSGTSAATNNYTLNAGTLSAGANNIRICGLNYAGVSNSVTATFNRNDTPPTTSHAPAGGNFNTIPTVTLSCAPACSIAYTTDGTSPAFNASGTITNGTLFPAGGFTVPDQTTTVVKYIGFDDYGNPEASVHSVSYNVDSTVPSVAITCLNHSGGACLANAGVGGGGGIFNTVDLTWTSSRAGLYYEVRVGGSDCTPSPSTPCTLNASIGTNGGTCQGSGTSALTQTISLTFNNFPWAGPANPTRICVFNLLGNPGASASTTVARWDAGPTLNFSPAPGTYSGSVNVSITCTGFGGCAKIHYTTDGSALTTNSLVNSHIAFTNGSEYTTGPIILSVPATTRLRVRAYDVSGNWSTNELDGTFIVTP